MAISPSSSAQAARAAVAKRLRDLQRDAGITGHEVARRTGFSEAKVSRIAHAKTPPSDSDIRAWCSACGAEDRAADIIAASRAADSMYMEWKKVHRYGMRRSQEDFKALLQRTSLCRIYVSNVAPGILQTREYATALMGAFTDFQGTPNDVTDAVTARLERGKLLTEGTTRFAIVLEETVLRYPFGDRLAMLAQLARIVEVMKLPRVSLGIIPFAAPRKMWPLEAFTMLDDEQVIAETLSANLTITAPSEIALYGKAFKTLSSMAVHGEAARGLVREAVVSLG
ncbi:helix-turn-helix domain-containing protein [Kitasatospora sp. NPDC001664]